MSYVQQTAPQYCRFFSIMSSHTSAKDSKDYIEKIALTVT